MINCTACYKKVKRSPSGEKNLILRGCDMEIPHYDLKCQYFYYSDRSFEETCTCKGEYCNGNDVTAKSLRLLVISSSIMTVIVGVLFELSLFWNLMWSTLQMLLECACKFCDICCHNTKSCCGRKIIKETLCSKHIKKLHNKISIMQ